MTVTFYNFTKRPNSTKQPTGGTSLTSVQLKEECSFQRPVLKIGALGVGTFDPSGYNYAYISLWHRYYFITDWKYLNGVWECYLEIDVLASFKTAIGNTQAYVIRSASQYNGDLIDNFYPATSVQNISKVQVSSDIYHSSIPSGCYVVGVISCDNTSNRVGAITYYALTASNMASLLAYLFSDNIYTGSNITEIGSGLYKSLFNPFQYISSCMWFPYPVSTLGSTTANIKVGYWNTGITGTLVTYITKEIGFKTNTAIPRHPQISRGAFLDHHPFTTLTLFYPPYGEIPIDTSFAQYGANNYLYGKQYIDFITGQSDVYITITDGYDINTTADPYKFMILRSAQVGVPIQLAQLIPDYSTATIAGGATVLGLTGNAVDRSSIFSSLISGVLASQSKLTTTGANGSFAEIIEPPYLIVEHKQVVDDNTTEFGRPLCNNRQISNLSGYIQCGEDDHAFGGTIYENREINKHLKNGFFYE